MKYGPNRTTGCDRLLWVVLAFILALAAWASFGCSSLKHDKCECKCESRKCSAECSAECKDDVTVKE